MDLQTIQTLVLTKVFPVISLFLGLLPLLWQLPERFRRRYWLNFPVLAALALLPSLIFLPSATYRSFSLAWLGSFAAFAVVLQRDQIAAILYRCGLNKVLKKRVAILIPSNASFNNELRDSVLRNLNGNFRPIVTFEPPARTDIFEPQVSNTDYPSLIRRIQADRFRFLIMHAGSSFLDQYEVRDAIKEFVISGGVIVNLVSDLGGWFDRRTSKGGVYSISLDDRAGVDALMESVKAYIKPRDKVLLLKAPRSSKTGDRRLDAVSTSLVLRRVTVDTIDIERWTAKAAYDALATQLKNRHYDWIIGWNDEIALGAIRYFGEAETENLPRIIGFDGLAAAKEALANKTLFATIDMRMDEIGAQAAQCIDHHCAGHTVPNKTVVGVGPRNVLRQ